MNWKGHLFLGATTFCGIYTLFLILDRQFNWFMYQNALIPLPTLIIALTVALYASLVPDTDIRTSMAYALSVVAIIATVWIMVIWYQSTPFLGLVAVSLAMIGLLIPSHRGFMHTVAFAVLFGLAMGILFSDWRITVFTTMCACSHLMGDK